MARVQIHRVTVMDTDPERVRVPITVPYARGTTTETAYFSAAQAEDLAHQLIIAAGEVRRRRQETARG